MRGGPSSAPSPAPEELPLPHLWQKPSFGVLLACLRNLRVEHPVWNLKTSRAEILQAQEVQQANTPREIIAFLSSVVKSSLAWLDGDNADDEREQLWEEASRRLAERCGRTALGEITRRWPFESDASNGAAFTLALREPPMNGDSLGLKTWGSSYVLAQLLPTFSSPGAPLAHLLDPHPRGDQPPLQVLELGSGTGLLGLAAACIWGVHVVLTDLPGILPNLANNASLNRETVEAQRGSVEAAALTWGGTDEAEVDPCFTIGKRYQLIIVADPLYDDDHPALLASTIHAQLGISPEARVLAMVPQRDEITKGLLRMLRTELACQSAPLVCVQESTVEGHDGDWGDNGDDDDSQRVGFWWGVFKREPSVSTES